MKNQPESMLQCMAQMVFDKKGFNLLALDVRGVSTITDYFLIAEGNGERHVRALSKSLQEKMAQFGEAPYRVEGEENGDWIVLDYLDIIVHLFAPGMRDRYRLEEVWKEGKIFDLELSVVK
jgi:ribosome-associated protein